MRIVFSAMTRALASSARHPRVAVSLGRVLAIGFAVCFGTGLFSHLLQDPLPGMTFPTRPVSLYRVTQGVHVLVGSALVPLLLAKLWTVYPLLFKWPPARSIGGVLERAAIALLVAAALVELATGLANTYQWYPWSFRFRQTHFALAWAIIGALLVHIGVKLPVIVRWWRRSGSVDARGDLLPVREGEGELGRPAPPARGLTGAVQRRLDRSQGAPSRVSRRTLLTATGLASAAVVVTTAGQSVPALAPVDAFAPRRVGAGPQGLPINKTAAEARIVAQATDPGWRLAVRAGPRTASLSLTDLRALPQSESVLPISCVEGWSTSAHWRGVRVRDVAELVGARGRDLVVQSLQHGAYGTTLLQASYAEDPLTLLALELNGEVLHVDHGYPVRLIAPARPGVLQTKWLASLEAR